MTADLPADPSPRALGESLAALAAQLADLRGQVRALGDRLDQAGLHAGLNLAARFEELAGTVAGALDAAVPRGPAAPSWIGLDRDTYTERLTDLQRWADTVLRQQYGSYELRDCWARHIHAIWELSTLAAEWHRTYAGTRPDLARALEFYDRWLPGTMRRITRHHPQLPAAMHDAPQPRRLDCSSPHTANPAPAADSTTTPRQPEGLADPGSHKGPVTLAIARPSAAATFPCATGGGSAQAHLPAGRVEGIELVHQIAQRPRADGRAVIGKHAQREDCPPPVIRPSWRNDGYVGLRGLELAAPLDAVLVDVTARQRPEGTRAVGPVHRPTLLTAWPASTPGSSGPVHLAWLRSAPARRC